MKRRSIGFAALLLLGACTTATNERYACSAVVASGRRIDVGAGSDEVLRMYRVTGIPIPDAFSGYALFLQVTPRLLHEGADLQIPSPGVTPYLWVLRAPEESTSRQITGRLRVRSVRPAELRARVDVAAPDLDWKYSGEVVFESAIRGDD